MLDLQKRPLKESTGMGVGVFFCDSSKVRTLPEGDWRDPRIPRALTATHDRRVCSQERGAGGASLGVSGRWAWGSLQRRVR
jgi:hypothetical protein